MSRTILLADDSVTIQKVIELTFMDEDYEVVAVGNGDDALEKLEEITPDFVIADVHMPGANGYDVAKHSKSLRPDVPVLLLVGTFEPFDEDQAKKSGCDAYLKKPFDSQELQRLVEELSAGPDQGTDLGGPLEATGWRAESPVAGAGSGAPEESKAEPFSIGLDDDDEPPSTRVDPPVFDLDALPESLDEAVPADLPDLEPMPEAEASGEEPDAPSVAEPEEPAFGDLPEEPPVVAEPVEPAPAPAPAAAPSPEPPAAPAEAGPSEPSPSSGMSVEGVPASEPPIEGVSSPLSDEDVDRVARRIVELLGDRAIREVAWEVVPDMAEVVVRSRLRELENQVETVE